MNFNGMKEVMLFPYNDDMSNIVRFREKLLFNISSIISFKAWGYVGRDPMLVNGGIPSGNIISSDFDSELEKVDTVVLGSFEKYYDGEGQCEKYVKKILEKGKNIIFLEHQKNLDIDKYKAQFSAIGKVFIDLESEVPESGTQELIRVPVIGIFGMEENCGKAQLQLLASLGLREKGYRVSMLGPGRQLALFGGHAYPDVIFSDKVGELEKARIVRAYANQLIAQERPDLLIMASPYGLNRFEDFMLLYRNSGLLSYMLTDAIRPDVSFICINAGKDLRQAVINQKTLEFLTCAPTIALSAKRFNRRFTHNTLKNMDFTIKSGMMNDTMFGETREVMEKQFGISLLDQDYLKPSQVAELITDRLDVQNKFAGAI